MVKPQKFTKWSWSPNGSVAALSSPTAAQEAVIRLQDLPDLSESWERVIGIFATDDGNLVVIGRQEGLMDREKRQYLEVVDITSGKTNGLIPLPENASLVDVDPDSRRVLYRSRRGRSDAEGLLTIARLADGKLTPIMRWEPYETRGIGGRAITDAWFMGSDRLITVDGSNKSVVVWDTEKAKAIFHLPLGLARQIEIQPSPDRSLLAIAGDHGIFIVDLTAGRHVATIPLSGDHFGGRLAFRDDNARLAWLADLNTSVWDLTNGELITKFNTPYTGGFECPLCWTGEYLLAGNSYLLDVDRRVLLWQYQDSLMTRENGEIRKDRFYIVPESSREPTLVSMQIPHASALEMAQTLPKPAEMLIAKKGDPVAVEVELDPSVSLTPEVQKFLQNSVRGNGGDENGDEIVMLNPQDTHEDLIRKALSNALEKAGFQVVPKSNLVVTAVCKPQPQQTLRINVDGRNPPRPEDIVERTVTPHATYLAFTMNGEILWKHGFIAKPDMVIYLEKGETLDQALVRVSQPNMLLFTHMDFGSHIAKPGTATPEGAYGVSIFRNNQLIDGESRPSGNAVIQ